MSTDQGLVTRVISCSVLGFLRTAGQNNEEASSSVHVGSVKAGSQDIPVTFLLYRYHRKQ